MNKWFHLLNRTSLIESYAFSIIKTPYILNRTSFQEIWRLLFYCFVFVSLYVGLFFTYNENIFFSRKTTQHNFKSKNKPKTKKRLCIGLSTKKERTQAKSETKKEVTTDTS